MREHVSKEVGDLIRGLVETRPVASAELRVHKKPGIRSLALLVVGLTPLSACEDPDLDKPWVADEQRQYFPTPDEAGKSDTDGFSFSFPVGVGRERFALAALESLKLGKSVTVRSTSANMGSKNPAYVMSLGTLTVQANSRMGSIYALGQRTSLDPSATVDGFVKTRKIIGDVRTRFGKLERAPLGVERFVLVSQAAAMPTRQLASFTSRATDTAPVVVLPGEYKSFTVEPQATLRLKTGHYTIDELILRKEGTLEIDNLSGPVYLWIREHIELKGEISESLFEPTLFFGYAGRDPLVLSSPFHGLLLAPRAPLSILAAAHPHVGSFFARSIDVEAGAVIEHYAFTRYAPRTSGSHVCEVCMAQAQVAARICCNQGNQWLTIHHQIASSCLVSCSDMPDSESCMARCEGNLTLRQTELDGWYLRCQQRARESLDGCIVSSRLRPDICLNLGYSDPAAMTCSW